MAGWKNKSRRSGWRDISSYLNTGWTGRLLASYDRGDVTMEAVDLVRGEGAPGTAWTTIPGMSPTSADTPPPGLVCSTTGVVYPVRHTQYGATIVPEPGVAIGGRVSYRTSRAVPSSWPGVQA